MQQTFQIKPGELNVNFIEQVKAMFGESELKIIIEEVGKKKPLNQKEIYKKSLPYIARFKDVKVDPKFDLSALANDVNL